MKKLLLASAIVVLAGSAWAQEGAKRVAPDGLKYTQNPATQKGIEGAIIIGDPTKAGSVVVQRVQFAPGTVVAPHTHPYDEMVTIISGNVVFGFGEKMDPAAAPDKPGTVIFNPAKNPHYVKIGSEPAVIQTQFVGPGGIDYLDPADDPRKK